MTRFSTYLSQGRGPARDICVHNYGRVPYSSCQVHVHVTHAAFKAWLEKWSLRGTTTTQASTTVLGTRMCAVRSSRAHTRLRGRRLGAQCIFCCRLRQVLATGGLLHSTALWTICVFRATRIAPAMGGHASCLRSVACWNPAHQKAASTWYLRKCGAAPCEPGPGPGYRAAWHHVVDTALQR